MRIHPAYLLFHVLLAALAGFVWISSEQLPAVVASHFAASGTANGFMPRDGYRGLMSFIVLASPMLVGLLPALMSRLPPERINLPHRQIWLDPAHLAATLAFLRLHGLWFGAALALLLARVHWLVIQANRSQPPQLATADMIGALIAFGLATLLWLIVLAFRFRKPHQNVSPR